MLHAMYFGDEIRDFDEIDKGENAKVKPNELQLAEKLINELANDKFEPTKYHDEYREKVMELVNQKVEGKEITTSAAPAERAQVIDLMDALKQSLEQRPKAGAKPERKPAAKATRTAAAAPKRKTASKR
jgi:DNA end-binding protein Ku